MQTSKIVSPFALASSEDSASLAIEITTNFDEFLSSGAILLENMQNAVCIVDNNMMLRYANNKLRNLTGERHSSVITDGFNFRDLLPKSRRVVIAVERCLAGENAVTVQCNLNFEGGGKHEPYVIQVQSLKSRGDGQVCGSLIVFYQDLDEYKKYFVEEKQELVQRVKVLSKDVLEKQSLIRNLLDKSPFGIALLDSERRVIQINNSASQILEINKRQAIGLSCDKIFQCYQADSGCPLKANHSVLDRVETQCASGGCSDKTLLRSVLLSKERGQEMILEAFVDISEIKEALAAKEMAYKAKDDFFSKMNHELRTPLNAIIGYSDLIAEDIDAIQREEMLECIGAIQRGGYDLLHIVDQVLDIAKIEDGRMQQEFFTKSLKLVLRELESTIRPLAEKGNNDLDVQCQEGVDTLYTEHEYLKRILLNLLGNACKFTENGCISLRVNREILDGKPWICFDVEDTGIGLNEEQLQRVFERFEQADNSTTRQYGGSGLGLSISNELCTLMGGHISAKSEPQKGSTFSVWIPEIQAQL